MTARPGNGYTMRETFVTWGLARVTEELRAIGGEIAS